MDYGLQKIYKEKSNITRTGYRALFLLKKLALSPLSREEIIKVLEPDPIINKDISKDSVTYTINTLKKAGCVISRPTRKTANKYVLKSHPFNITLKEEHIDALLTFRDTIVSHGDWELLIHMNNLYAKLARIAPNAETRDALYYKHPLRDINFDIINNLIIYSKTGRKALLLYDSPINGEEELGFSPEFITFENEKLYVWGHNLKYNSYGYLRIDKIKDILTHIYSAPKADEDNFKKPVINVKYRLKGYSAIMYSPNEYEILADDDDTKEFPLLIRAEVSNKFNFYQKILSYGTDCKIISPESAKKEFLDILKAIKTGYDHGR